MSCCMEASTFTLTTLHVRVLLKTSNTSNAALTLMLGFLVYLKFLTVSFKVKSQLNILWWRWWYHFIIRSSLTFFSAARLATSTQETRIQTLQLSSSLSMVLSHKFQSFCFILSPVYNSDNRWSKCQFVLIGPYLYYKPSFNYHLPSSAI